MVLHRSGCRLAFLALAFAAAPAFAGRVELLSKAGTAGPSAPSGNGPSSVQYGQAASATGRFVVFGSQATDLIPGQVDTNGGKDIFLRDRVAGQTILVSRHAGSATTTAGDASFEAVISSEGRYVAFTSLAPNLVPGQTGDGRQAFLFDRQTGSTVVASVPFGTSSNLQPSADGRYLAFITDSVLFLYDRVTASLTQPQPGRVVTSLLFTQDGRYISYATSTPDSLPGHTDANGDTDVFLYNRETGATVLVSHGAASSAAAGNGAAFLDGLSSDGRFVLFRSGATDLVAGQVDANGQPDLFLFDRTTGAVTLVSHAASSPVTSASQGTSQGTLSLDGRFAAFTSSGTDLVAGQQNAAPGGVFLFDRLSGGNVLVSHVAGSLTTSGGGQAPALGGDGSRIVFLSASADLIPGLADDNGLEDLFLYDRFSGSLELVSRTFASPGVTGNAGATPLTTVSEDGRVVVFTSASGDLVPSDSNLAEDVFAFVPEELDFHTLSPCRLFDSRRPEDGPALPSGFARVIAIAGACGIPATAKALAVNVTVVTPGSAGYLTLYPGDGLPPVAATLTFSPGETRTNNATVRLAPSGTGTLAIRPVLGGSVHMAIDVVGYFE